MAGPIFDRPEDREADERAHDEISKMLEGASIEEIERFCRGTLRVTAGAMAVFKRRFPAEFHEWSSQLSKEYKLP